MAAARKRQTAKTGATKDFYAKAYGRVPAPGNNNSCYIDLVEDRIFHRTLEDIILEVKGDADDEQTITIYKLVPIGTVEVMATFTPAT